jgi:hypothetical protein
MNMIHLIGCLRISCITAYRIILCRTKLIVVRVVTATIRSVLIRRWWLVLLDRIGGIVGDLIALLVKRKQLFLIMHNFTFPLPWKKGLSQTVSQWKRDKRDIMKRVRKIQF